MKRTLNQTIVLELLSLLAIPVLLLVSGEDKALIIRLDGKDIEKSDAIVADLGKNEQQRSERYILPSKQRTSAKYTDSNPVTGLILDKGLSYVLLRPEDAQRFKLKKDADNDEKASKFLLIPEHDLKSYNRSDYHRSSYQIPVKHNTISVEVVDGDSNSENDLEPEQYSTRTKKRSPSIQEIISVTSPYDSDYGERRPIERRQRHLLHNSVIPPFSPRPPIAPRSPAFLIRHPIPRYYARDLHYPPYPHTKSEYGPPAPNFAGTRLYHMPPPGPFRGLLARSPPLYYQSPKYTPGSPNTSPYHYTSAVRPLRLPPSHGSSFTDGTPPEILFPIVPPKAITKAPVPSYYSDPNSYGKKGGFTHINGEHRPSYYANSGPSSYNKKKQLPPSIGTSDHSTPHSPSFYESSNGKPSPKDYVPTSYPHSRPPPPESAGYSPPHPDMYANYKPSKNQYSNSYKQNSPPPPDDRPPTYENYYKKYTPISSDYSGEKTYEPYPYHHKDSDSSYEPPTHYNKDLSSSYETPVDYHKDSYSYQRPPNDHSKVIHASYGPANDHSKETYSPYAQSGYPQDPIQPYDSPRDYVKDSYEPPRDYPTDSHSSYGYPSKHTNEGPSSYHHPSEPSHQSFDKPTYFTENDAISSPGPYQHPESFEPFRKQPTPESEKHLEYPQSLEISSEVPDYHKAKKNYEPVRPPPKSSLTTRKLHPPLPPARKAQSSTEEDNSKGNHYDHHKSNDNYKGNHYDHHKGNDNYKSNHYDHHYHYNSDRVPPNANHNHNDFPKYSPQPPSHSKTFPSISYSISNHDDIYPHSGERTYYSSPNTPSYYHSEPKSHSSEEYDENYHDKPTAASKSYIKSEADYGYHPQAEPEHQHYKSHTVPVKLKHHSTKPKGRSKYIAEHSPSHPSPPTYAETLPSKPNHSLEEDDIEHPHKVRKFRKRPRLKYGLKSYKSNPQDGVWRSNTSPSKQSIHQARHISDRKNTYKQTPNNYEDNTSSYEHNDEHHIDNSNAAIPGVPGKDYPVMSRVPSSDFNCFKKAPGFYADIKNRCQVYYQCSDKGLQQSFLCPNGTIFNQETFVCEWWHNVDCANSEKHFSRNNDLYKVPEPNLPKDRRHVPQSRHTAIKKLRYSGPSINSHQPYRDRPVYRPAVRSRHHQEHDYKESRSSADYEPYGSATENKEQYVAHVVENKDKVSEEHGSPKEAKSPNSKENSEDFFDAKRTKKT